MKKKDFIFIGSIIIISVLLFAFNALKSSGGDTVLIYYNDELIYELPLGENTEINVNNTNTVVIENGYVYMKDATCPDKLCEKQGKISDSSRDIVCLPNKVLVKVTKKSEIDSVAR